jgi:hypothetical protein
MTNSRVFRSSFLLPVLLLSAIFSQAQVITNRAALQQASQMKAIQERDIRQLVVSLASKNKWPLTIRNKAGRLAYLRGVSQTGHPIYITTNDNIISAATIRTTSLWPGGNAGLNLNGSSSYMTGMIGVWDEGKVRNTHVELNGRVSQIDGASTLSDHSTHVAGTMIAAGVNPVAKGMSYGALNLKAYDFNSDQSEMMNAAQAGMLVSNHSYSIIAGWYYNGDESRWEWWGNHGDSVDVNFGLYDNDTRTWDSIAYNAPFYLIAKAAGNNRSVIGPRPTDANPIYYYYNTTTKTWVSEKRIAGKISDNAGYMIIATYGNAKNILTVGAINPIPGGYGQPSDAVITDFSSWGPTGDGRIKPDVVADGANVLSSVSTSDNAYNVFSGTSMASPAAAGSSFLLQEYWSGLHGHAFMRSATLRGLLIHTADEAGPTPGPDYQYGWGVINMEKAASVITSDNTAKKDQMVVEDQLTTGANEADSITVIASGTSPLTATICWTDPAGVPVTNIPANFHDAGIKLVNDLDLRVIDVTSGVAYQPWILNPATPSAAAARGDNIRDNVEKVQVDSLIPGRTYKIRITHKGTLAKGGQAYSLLVSGAGGTAYCTSAATGTTGSFISSVNVGGHNNATAGDCGKQYNDQTATIAPQLAVGKTIPIKVNYQTCSGTASTNIAIYIDFNNDGDFNDAGELAAQGTGLNSTTAAATFTGNITVPVTTKPGTFSRMRIIVQDGAAATPAACGTYTAGETQDYRVMFAIPDSDVGVAGLESPSVASCANNTQIVTIRIRNYGTTPQNAVPVTTTIKDGGGNTIATLTAICKDTLPGKSDVVFTYNTSFKAVAGTNYTFTSKTSLSSDLNTSNDQNVTGVAINAGSSSATGTATICGISATNVSLKATTSGNDIAFWYDSPTATAPIAAGDTATTTVIPTDKTYYLGVNDLGSKLAPANKNTFAGGAGNYARFGGNFIQLSTSVPLTLESAKMYIGHSGQISFTLATLISRSGDNYSYSPLSTTTIDVYATRTVPSSAQTSSSDAADTGGIFNLNIPIPTPGNYIIIIDCSDSTSAFLNINSTATLPYPVTIPGVISITGNDQRSSTDSTTYFKKFWFPFYDLSVRLASCPGAARIPVVAGTLSTPTPVITQNVNVFTSSVDDGNQWYRSGILMPDSTAQSIKALYSGTYQDIVYDAASGCSLASNSIPFVSTATNDVNGSSIGLKVSPNPNDGVFQLQFTMATPDNTSIILLNTLGQKVYEEDNSNFSGTYNKTINAGNLASGMYVLKILHGNNTYIRKILVKK